VRLQRRPEPPPLAPELLTAKVTAILAAGILFVLTGCFGGGPGFTGQCTYVLRINAHAHIDFSAVAYSDGSSSSTWNAQAIEALGRFCPRIRRMFP
jgi:hypothetical protein